MYNVKENEPAKYQSLSFDSIKTWIGIFRSWLRHL